MAKLKIYAKGFIANMTNYGLASDTITKHKRYLTKGVLPAIGDLEAKKIKLEDCSLVLVEARKQFPNTKTCEHRTMLTLRKFLEYVQNNHIRMRFEWQAVRVPKRLPHRAPDSFSLEEMKEICEACDLSNFYDLRMRFLIESIFRAGFRISELLSLNRFKDVDVEKEIFRIYDAKSGKEEWKTVPGIRPILKRMLAMRKDENPALLIGGKHYWETGALDKDGAQSHMRRFKKRFDGKVRHTLGFHKIRRTHCTFQLRNGIDIVSVQLNVGHASPTTTMAHYLAIQVEEAQAHKDKLFRTIELPMVNYHAVLT